MILAEVNIVNETLLMVRFSEPNESFDNKKFIPVNGSIAEVQRMVYFKNRHYIAETLCSFLRQRAHALNSHATIINTMLENIGKLRQTTLINLSLYIFNNRSKIELVAPNENSRYYNHYQKNILPILNFCTNGYNVEDVANNNIQRAN